MHASPADGPIPSDGRTPRPLTSLRRTRKSHNLQLFFPVVAHRFAGRPEEEADDENCHDARDSGREAEMNHEQPCDCGADCLLAEAERVTDLLSGVSVIWR